MLTRSPDRRDDLTLVRATLSRDEGAWRELIDRHTPTIRQVLRETYGLDEAAIDDAVGELWLRLVDDDMRVLRRFRGGSLATFLTMQASSVVDVARRDNQALPTFVPLDEVRQAADPRSDLTALAALLQLPSEVQALRAEVVALRRTIDQMRRAIPPALVSVSDAARALGVSEVTVRRMIRQGRLAHVRIGRSVKVDLTREPVQTVNADDGRRAALRLTR